MINNDVYKLKEAFNRVKEDILYLNDKIKRLEDENNYLKKKIAIFCQKLMYKSTKVLPRERKNI